MIQTTIINVGIGQWYPRGSERLKNSIKAIEPDIETAFYNSYPDGCASHDVIPYGFKVYAIAIEADKFLHSDSGRNILIWMDSASWLKKPIQPILDVIAKQGYWFTEGGWNNAQWCSDRQLEAFGYSRDEAEKQNHVMACCFGIDIATEIGQIILQEYADHLHLFPGKWNNDTKSESTDPRCLGSRHDQSILSLICAKHNLTITKPTGLLSYNIEDDAVIVSQGM